MTQVDRVPECDMEEMGSYFNDLICQMREGCTQEIAVEAIGAANELVEATAQVVDKFPQIPPTDPVKRSFAICFSSHRDIMASPAEALGLQHTLIEVKDTLDKLSLVDPIRQMFRVLFRCYVAVSLAAIALGYCQPRSGEHLANLECLMA